MKRTCNIGATNGEIARKKNWKILEITDKREFRTKKETFEKVNMEFRRTSKSNGNYGKREKFKRKKKIRKKSENLRKNGNFVWKWKFDKKYTKFFHFFKLSYSAFSFFIILRTFISQKSIIVFLSKSWTLFSKFSIFFFNFFLIFRRRSLKIFRTNKTVQD